MADSLSAGAQDAAAPPDPDDIHWMERALALAQRAADAGEVPVGAVIVRDGKVLAEAHNGTISGPDPTAHAEILAIRASALALGDWRLLDATLYVTLEPCSMCAGAIVLARLPRVVYAAPDPKAGMVDSLGDLLRDERLNHRCSITAGVLADDSAAMLRAFFRARR